MKTLTIATATAVLALAAGTASAATVVALTGERSLALVDTDAMAVTDTLEVSGFDGMLYGLGADGSVMTIDPSSGKATGTGMIDIEVPEGAHYTVDFNPAADALRIMASDGTNLRSKIDQGAVTEDGGHAFAENDMHAGETPAIVAGAYTNSYASTEETALYTIDATIAGLIRQDPPNDGTLVAIGKLGVEEVDTVGFDILSDGEGGNRAWLMVGDTLYEVDLASGAATEVGAVEGLDGAVRDIAILPTM